jgi:hypothetical protein
MRLRVWVPVCFSAALIALLRLALSTSLRERTICF